MCDNTQMKVVLLLALVAVITLTVVDPVAAQGSGEILPCGGESVSGTVVAVDEETGVVTIDMGGGLCTVALGGEYNHPVVALLGSYFGGVSPESLAAALEVTQGCAVYDADSETWRWADCDAEGAVEVTVNAENEDGTFAATAIVDGEEQGIVLTVDDSMIAESLSEALQALTVEWNLGEDGTVVQPGDEIASYHEEGMGFGVLVKLYAMAAESAEACANAGEEPCGVTVGELVDAFQSGMGMGQLFKEYGKPSMLGVGHVRQQEKDKEHGGGPPAHAGPRDNANPPGHDRPKKPKRDK